LRQICCTLPSLLVILAGLTQLKLNSRFADPSHMREYLS
jgi:hypothetical protein